MNRPLLIRLAVLFILVGICGLGALTSSSLKQATATPVGQAGEMPAVTPLSQADETPATTPVSQAGGIPITATVGQATPTPTRSLELLPTNTPAPPPPTPTSTPTPAEQPTDQPLDQPPAKEMIAVPGGEFTMGSDSGDPDEAPSHTVSVAPFEIDKTEVTNAEFAAFVEATDYHTEEERAGFGSWRDYAEGRENHPVVKVSWTDADAYCTWAGKRLPTEVEWEYAARGSDGRIYPWGNAWDPDAANGRERGIRSTAAVGSFAAGASPFGVLDMAGNVREWTADWYDKYPGSSFSSQFFNVFRVHRGGGWWDPPEELRVTNRNGGPPETANDDLGFRCARDVSP